MFTNQMHLLLENVTIPVYSIGRRLEHWTCEETCKSVVYNSFTLKFGSLSLNVQYLNFSTTWKSRVFQSQKGSKEMQSVWTVYSPQGSTQNWLLIALCRLVGPHGNVVNDAMNVRASSEWHCELAILYAACCVCRIVELLCVSIVERSKGKEKKKVRWLLWKNCSIGISATIYTACNWRRNRVWWTMVGIRAANGVYSQYIFRGASLPHVTICPHLMHTFKANIQYSFVCSARTRFTGNHSHP